jgi:hypothetical protein
MYSNRFCWLSLCFLLCFLSLGLGHAHSRRILSIPYSAQCALKVDVRNDARAACWRAICDDNAPQELGCDLSALHLIDRISVSPDRRYLAVVSVGEGHPILEIVQLAPLLKPKESRAREANKFVVKCSVNPYPGTLSFGAWEPNALRLRSDVNLTLPEPDIEQRALSIGSAMHDFWLNLSNCSVLATAIDIQAPARRK